MGQQVHDAQTITAQKEPRRAPRLHPDQATSNLGEVLDISVTGVRLRGRHLAPGSKHLMRISCCDLTVGPLTARVVWLHKRRCFQWDTGLKFEGLDEATSAALERVVMVSRTRRTM